MTVKSASRSIDFITAHICGKHYTCRIDRDDLGYFENRHGSAIGLLSHIRCGAWTREQLLAILEFATLPRPSPVDPSNLLGLQNLHRSLLESRNPLFPRPSPPPSEMALALKERGPAVYVPLALLILTAALMGVPEEDAHFSDEPDA